MNVAMVSHAPNVSQIGLYPQVGHALRPVNLISIQMSQLGYVLIAIQPVQHVLDS